MKRTTIFIVFMFVVGLVNAQVIYDFETTGNVYVWNDLSNNSNPPYVIANPVKDDNNPSDSVSNRSHCSLYFQLFEHIISKCFN